MGTYTMNYNLFMPTVGEQGWGELVNGNFSIIDTTMENFSNRIGTLETETAAIEERVTTSEEKIEAIENIVNEGDINAVSINLGTGSIRVIPTTTQTAITLGHCTVSSGGGETSFYHQDAKSSTITISITKSSTKTFRTFDYNYDPSIALNIPCSTTWSNGTVNGASIKVSATVNGITKSITISGASSGTLSFTEVRYSTLPATIAVKFEWSWSSITNWPYCFSKITANTLLNTDIYLP